MTYVYAFIIFVCGALAGLLGGIFCFCGKITDMQEQINHKCDACSYRLLNHQQRERVGSVTRR